MKIIIEITNQEIIESYKDVCEEIIADDFYDNPKAWIFNAEIKIEK